MIKAIFFDWVGTLAHPDPDSHEIVQQVMLEMTRRLRQVARNLTWVLYDDVLPTIKKLKKRGLILGLISNLPIAKSASASLEPYLDFVVTSNEAGASKPESPVFLMALEQAGVNGSEAVYVGDQYQTDVVGARAVGIKPILIDRFDLEREFSDCSRIYRLSEVTQYL